jgi:DNA-binding CsgD family transcriptional regulator
MPALVQWMHALIPSHSNHFFWSSAEGEISNAYVETVEELELLPLYFTEFYNREAEVGSLPFAEKMRRVAGVHLDPEPRSDPKVVYGGDFYHLVLRPIQVHHALGAVIRSPDGRALGLLRLARSDGEAPFSSDERRRLTRLAPFVAHAVMNDDIGSHPSLVDSENSGLLIVDQRGKPMHISPRARALLRLASHHRIAPGHLWDEDVSDAVSRICQRLAAVTRRESDGEMPPTWSCRNGWGEFAFRAHWLDRVVSPDPDAFVPGQLIGITIKQREPLPLVLLRRMQDQPSVLSGRQMQVCLLLAAGHSLRIVAERLGVTLHTADYHCRELYARFDVRSRHELIGKLLNL